MKLVIIESPFAASATHTREQHEDYARACMADSLERGEAPYASHLLYTQPGVLDDGVPEERHKGMEAGFAWGSNAEISAVYEDLGYSSGMREGMRRAGACGRRIEVRRLHGDVFAALRARWSK